MAPVSNTEARTSLGRCACATTDARLAAVTTTAAAPIGQRARDGQRITMATARAALRDTCPEGNVFIKKS